MSSACRQIFTQIPDNGFNRFNQLCIKYKEGKIFLSEEFLYGVLVHFTFSCYPGSGRSVPEELPTHGKV
jgi:hypothetical protein